MAYGDTSTLSLTDFLLARIAEDEAEVGPGPFPPWRPTYPTSRNGIESTHDGLIVDPARVLAECEAKRRIVEEHDDDGYNGGRCHSCRGLRGNRLPLPCPTLRALASVYADHPDYRQEWKP